MVQASVSQRIQEVGVDVNEKDGGIRIEWSKIPFSESDRPYWAALSSIDGVGPATLPVLVAGFGSARAVLTASRDDLTATGLSEKVILRIRKRSDLLKSDLLQRWFSTMLHPLPDVQLTFLVPPDPSYPSSLRLVDYGPSHLWAWGDVELLNHPRIIAVVGTRKITPYGISVTTTLSQGLARAGCAIISGLMYGVDEVAMRAAMSAGGNVIGVWAGGLTPRSFGGRVRLARDVVHQSGVAISEFAPTLLPNKGTFPARNRIVAGLSRGVVVTEGASDSGSLITARNAVEQGKPVGAVPGPITSSLSEGSNDLLKLGASPITNAKDVLLMCGIDSQSSKIPRTPYTPKTPNESAVFNTLADHAMTTDELSRATKLSVSILGELLTSLELVGTIRQNGEEWEVNR